MHRRSRNLRKNHADRIKYRNQETRWLEFVRIQEFAGYLGITGVVVLHSLLRPNIMRPMEGKRLQISPTFACCMDRVLIMPRVA